MNHQIDLDLLERIRCGDNQAKEDLVRKYQPMVSYILKQQHTSREDFDDFFQEGAIGLLKAIMEYNPNQYQIKFSTFAYICIIRRVFNTIKSTQRKRYLPQGILSLNNVIGDDDSRTFLDALADWEAEPFTRVEANWIGKRLDAVLQAYLSPVEYQVIKLLLNGYHSNEIQEELGLSLKVIDNARTRVKLKLKKVLSRYGSLLNPQLPLKTRKRKDLAIQLEVS